MSLGTVESRAAAAVIIMSVAFLCLLRKGGALRGLPVLKSFSGWPFRNGFPPTQPRSGMNAAAVAEGPEGTDLPEVMHRVMEADELKAEVIIVGDVHGCHSEMVTLLKRCGYRLGNQEDRERFSVVLAGDLVNKGPGNAEVVRTARKEGFLAVRGNHDNFILAAATGVGRFSNAFTLEERLKSPPWVQELSSDDVRWLSALPYTLSFPSMGFIVVHAGLVPGVPLERQDTTAMSCMRNVVESETGRGYEPRVNAKEGIPWAKAWKGPEHVYFGHDAVRGFQKEPFATGLDTGCVYGRSLTAVVLPGGRIVCVPAEAEWEKPGAPKKALR